MSSSTSERESLITNINLDRLDPPEHDVRDKRDPSELRNLAQSLDENGQIQPLTCYAGALPEANGEFSREDLSLGDLIERAESIEIIDGMSRLQAAEQLGWPYLRCEVFRDPPEHIAIMSLAANTDRLPMNGFETIRALKTYKEESGETLETVGQKAGYSASHLSNMFSCLEAPEFIVEAWRSPDTSVELGHVAEIRALPTEDLQRRVLQDAVQYGRPVSHTREVARNAIDEAERDARAEQSAREKQLQGQSEHEAQKIERQRASLSDRAPCDVCGEPHEAQVALNVCESDYGLVKQLQRAGEPLLSAVSEATEPDKAAEGEPPSP